MFFKIANLFIWWNGQTIGTFLYTKFFGVFVGGDEYGNTYFTTTDGKKRWVNYKGDCNASSISPIWHSWLHKTTNNIPSSIEEVKINKKENLNFEQIDPKKTYNPKNFEKKSLYNDYTPWKP
jgi:NADH:ubiquinone oxidoreductase subunit